MVMLRLDTVRLYIVVMLCVVVVHNVSGSMAMHGQGGHGGATISGVVRRSHDGTPIHGASIRVEGLRIGTYTDRNGRFKLHVPEAKARIIVRSIGSTQTVVDVSASDDTIDVRLDDDPVVARDVVVVGAIRVEDVIRRTIARKQQNWSNVQRISAVVHNRTILTTERSAFGSMDSVPEYREYLSQYDILRDSTGVRSAQTVLERRSSRSSGNDEIVGFDEPFDDFYTDSIVLPKRLGGIILVRPLADDALERYHFTLVERKVYGDRIVYVVDFEPRSRLGPAFEGTMHIIEGTYDVVSARYRTTDETAIPLVDSIMLEQRYEEVASDIWLPTFIQFTAHASAGVLAGMVRRSLSMTTRSQALSYRVNDAVPDAVIDVLRSPDTAAVDHRPLRDVAVAEGGSAVMRKGQLVSVAEGANAQPDGYWDSVTVATPTTEESALMARADQIPPPRKRPTAADDSTRSMDIPTSLFSFQLGPTQWNVSPILTRTTVTGWLAGGEARTSVGPLTFSTEATFSSARAPMGAAGMSIAFPVDSATDLRIGGRVMSTLRAVPHQPPSIGSRIDAGMILFGMQRDQYLVEGVGLHAAVASARSGLAADVEQVTHRSLQPIEELGRPVVRVQDGRFMTGRLRFATLDSSLAALASGLQRTPFLGSVELGVASPQGTAQAFGWIQASASVVVPTIRTGYEPMHLRIGARGNAATSGTPNQFLFYSTPRFTVIGDAMDLLTIPLYRYGGDRHYQLVVEHHFSDHLWRAIGLPTYNRRGLDLTITYAAARFEQVHGTMSADIRPTTNGWFQEIGIGLDRIPTFIVDHLNVRLDLRTPVGAYQRDGRPLGWSIGITSALF